MTLHYGDLDTSLHQAHGITNAVTADPSLSEDSFSAAKNQFAILQAQNNQSTRALITGKKTGGMDNPQATPLVLFEIKEHLHC
ncbi:hypothetical protein AB205_0035870 [Aquarana catesbeiana]|uniref:Uncharacterized protein n=1 Tax=Aquarana catesbeiana TaxID=8400 RepID=A0A2G9SF05_AQUCT|nr:hypothetical protein AB205_0035870 [Aquarana catesbeiana]